MSDHTYLTYPFLQNKYHACYIRLIQRCLRYPIKEMPGYTERHHILPKSLGGNEDPENFVTLTTKEHFIAHALLVKCNTGHALRSMRYAFRMMGNTSSKSTNAQSAHRKMKCSRIYIANKLALSKLPMSDDVRKKISDSHKGLKASDEARKNISIAFTGRICKPETREKHRKNQTGKIFTEESRLKMSIARSGIPTNHPCSEETREKHRKNQTGKRHTDAARLKMRLAHLGVAKGPHSESTRQKMRDAANKRCQKHYDELNAEVPSKTVGAITFLLRT